MRIELLALLLCIISCALALRVSEAIKRSSTGTNELSMGELSFYSYLIYAYLPLAAKSWVGYSFITSVPKASSVVIGNQLLGAIVAATFMTFGYIITTHIFLTCRKRRGRPTGGPTDWKEDIYTLQPIILTIGITVLLVFVAGFAFDIHDRASQHNWSSLPRGVIEFLPIKNIGIVSFFYLAGRYALAKIRLFLAHKNASEQILEIILTRGDFAILATFTLVGVMALKLGSRSYISASTISFLFGFCRLGNWNPKRLLIVLSCFALLAAMAIPAAETIRIARSYSTYFELSPAGMFRSIRSSVVVRPDIYSFIKLNRRDELSEGVFLTGETCKSIIDENTVDRESNIKGEQAKYLLNCSRYGEDRIGLKYYYQNLADLKELPGSRSKGLFEGQERHSLLAKRMSLGLDSVSSGERLNLLADTFNRFGLIGLGLAFLVKGIFISTIGEVVSSFSRRYYRLKLTRLLPLIWLISNFSFPLITQTWFFFILWPRVIAGAIALSWLTNKISNPIFPGLKARHFAPFNII